MGYSPRIKGYKLYDIQSKQIFISRDVVFYENIFPFHTLVSSDRLADPFPDLVLPHPFLKVTTVSSSSLPPDYISQDNYDVGNSIEPIVSHLPDSHNIYDNAPVRKATRSVKPPSYLRDFHCNLLSHKELPPCNSSYPLSNYLFYNSLSSSHKDFVMNVSSQYEPQFYHQAVRCYES